MEAFPVVIIDVIIVLREGLGGLGGGGDNLPLSPFSPSLISLMVSVDVKHHVYLGRRSLLW